MYTVHIVPYYWFIGVKENKWTSQFDNCVSSALQITDVLYDEMMWNKPLYDVMCSIKSGYKLELSYLNTAPAQYTNHDTLHWPGM